MPEPILELRHVRKQFGRAVPADDISLAIAGGEFFTFLGPSGSGKVALLRIVAGLEQADAARCCCAGATSAMCCPGGAISAWCFSNMPIRT